MSLKNIGILVILIVLAMLIGLPKSPANVPGAKDPAPAAALPQTGITSGQPAAAGATPPPPAAQLAPLNKGHVSEVVDDVPPGAEISGDAPSPSPPLPGQ